ncbi:MAG: DDE-type integrase/transposase/recombinase [Campylobacteraceae bacterium]|jgi:transposase InsO family protein|nr:DDE-type integrase/transposase/recombinase [Campylobacteraceae bacterium]
MWVTAKEAVPILGIEYIALKVQIHRKTAKFKYRYVEGKGRGGRTLEIWIDDTAKSETVAKPAQKRHMQEKPVNMHRSNAFLRLKAEKQSEILERVELIKSYVNRPIWMSFSEWAEGKNLPTRAHFLKWVRLYRQGIRNQNALDLFCDNRGRPRESFKMTQEMRQAAECYILQTKTHPSDVVIYACMKQYFGDALPSCDTVLRYLKWYRESNKALILHKENPDKAKGKSLAAFGNASEIAKYKNHYWELDGTPADLICSDGIRYTIIAALDIYSRRVCLTVEPKSNSYALARNMREAILKLGVPENVVCDNGRDYKSNHFESVLQNLGINKKEVPPFSGQNKPHVERFFGTLTRELFSSLEGYVGPDVATRSAIQSQMSYERKLNAIKEWKKQQYTSDSFKRAMTSKKEVMEVFVPLSADELRAWVNAWVDAVYEQRKHGGINMTPMEKYNADITPARTVEDTRMLDILLGEWREMTVGKKGIVIRRDGIDAEYQDIKLIGYIGERVYVALGQDAGEVYVYNAEMAPICVAIDESMKGKSREQIRALHKEMGKIEREKTKLVKRANELMEKMQYPAYKDVIASAAKVALPAKQTKQAHKIDIELPDEHKEDTVMNGDRPLFTSDFDALVWAIENNKEAEFGELINERSELYELAKNEVEYRTKERAG